LVSLEQWRFAERTHDGIKVGVFGGILGSVRFLMAMAATDALLSITTLVRSRAGLNSERVCRFSPLGW
jgi:hypothetical protein